MLFDWKSVILFAGAAQGLLMGLVLLFSSKENSHKRIFGLLILLFSIHLIEYSLFLTPNGFFNAIDLFGYRYPIRLSIGPLFLLYTIKLTQRNKLSVWKVAVHFIPAFISVILFFPFFFLGQTDKANLFSNYVPFGNSLFIKTSLISMVSVVSMFAYVLISVRKIAKYRRLTEQYHSNERGIWVFYFQRFSFICLIVLFGYVIAVFLRQLQIFDASNLFYIMSLLLTINLIALTVIVIMQNKIIPFELSIIENENSVDKPDEININIDQKNLDRINFIMTQKQLFLDFDFTINDLAEELEMPAYVVSKIINNGFNKTFFRYVNEFRVEHAKHLLLTTNIKILAVALDSGFSNKASFHRTFKRIVETTPYNYRLKNKS
ncbi:AraC family transcriptional regulator [uncultured Psychroserpens sp.]|uniref:helix-turn-helix domain-containing protein n=1 Tax=uncultured Psychroserpens sp. TaxID=255436 RepID=UPI002637E9A0|nr:AraC family transcriptional regulator [uncultured Psychroserpens sp.]